jgi:hypothetical protein
MTATSYISVAKINVRIKRIWKFYMILIPRNVDARIVWCILVVWSLVLSVYEMNFLLLISCSLTHLR